MSSRKEVIRISRNRKRYGTYILHLPYNYLLDSATPSEALTRDWMIKQIKAVSEGRENCIVVPDALDENGKPFISVTRL